jgi:hypothetical protein
MDWDIEALKKKLAKNGLELRIINDWFAIFDQDGNLVKLLGPK